MVVFIAMSQILNKTKIIDNCVMIILSIVGKIPGGAGYAAIIASCFMGAFSGSGPGNVVATGSITIPAMKKSGFPAELAANVESTSSCLGNMIPPSSNIVAALGAFLAVYPDSDMTIGKFWMVCWCVSGWFIFSRIVQLFLFCKYYKISSMTEQDRPKFRETIRKGWTGLLLPVIILFPFIFDSIFNDSFLVFRLGEVGAKYFSSSLLVFTAGIASVYGIVASKNRKQMTIKNMVMTFIEGLDGLVPTVGTCILGYMIGALFSDINAADDLQIFVQSLDLGLISLSFLIPLITCFISMVIPGSSIVVMFGAVIISLFASAGANPLLVAVMLPCMCGVMSGITPPFALAMYAGMSIAKSDFAKTVKNDLWWVFVQYIMEVVVLLGWLPIFGI